MVFSKKVSAIALVATMAVGVMITPMSASAASTTLTDFTKNNTSCEEIIDLSEFTSTSVTTTTKTLTINNNLSNLLTNVYVPTTTKITTTTTTNNGRLTINDCTLNPLLLNNTQTKTSVK